MGLDLVNPTTNSQALLTAQVVGEYGDSVVIRRYGISSVGQEYCIFTRKRLLGGYQTHMVTMNRRSRPFISAPFKISGYQVYEEAQDFVRMVMNVLSSPKIFHLGNQPPGVSIPTGKDMLQLYELPSDVHDKPDRYILPGEEVYCELDIGGITFYHSGIYAGRDEVYHFLSHSQDSESTLVAALSSFVRTPAQVVKDSFYDFVHALTDVGEEHPKIYLVTHPFLCRRPEQILAECERLQDEWDWYDIRSRNCQHFSSLCARGAMISYDMGNNLKYLACTLLRPSGMLAAHRLQMEYS